MWEYRIRLAAVSRQRSRWYRRALIQSLTQRAAGLERYNRASFGYRYIGAFLKSLVLLLVITLLTVSAAWLSIRVKTDQMVSRLEGNGSEAASELEEKEPDPHVFVRLRDGKLELGADFVHLITQNDAIH